ncbi:MAG: putative lipid II flippase FtsW [Deltaproteobacteria bacterium]|jgi:cell division protein FtsW|nr:putative lipid II flippase FtsW [Deltaproteobacteria bacterium]
MKLKLQRQPLDTLLLTIIIMLMGLGVTTLLSASFSLAEVTYQTPYYYFFSQLKHLGLGCVMMLILSQIPYNFFVRFSELLGIFALLLLVLILVPGMAREVKGAGRWMILVPFQPSEATKLAVVVFLARYFSMNKDSIHKFWYGFVVPSLVMVLACGLIVLEKDLGGAIVVFVIVTLMMLAAGVRLWNFAFFISLVPLVMVLINIYKHRISRVISWLDPWSAPQAGGFSIIHSFYAFANGGLFGAGPGEGQQKMFFLPEVHTDYIFSILGEELGLVGVIATCLLFLGLAYRGFMIARAAKNLSGFHTAIGMTLTILVPACINMCVAVSLIPAKGLPLPFFSYGGSSLIVSCTAIGILLNVSAQSQSAAQNDRLNMPLVVKPYVKSEHIGVRSS